MKDKTKLYIKEYYQRNKESILEKAKIHRQTEQYKKRIQTYNATDRRKRSNRDSSLKKRYGISLEDYEMMLVTQNSCCAICEILEADYIRRKGRNFDVDHCHTTGKVRGLLCYRCNVVLGFLEERKELLESIDIYLTTHL